MIMTLGGQECHMVQIEGTVIGEVSGSDPFCNTADLEFEESGEFRVATMHKSCTHNSAFRTDKSI